MASAGNSEPTDPTAPMYRIEYAESAQQEIETAYLSKSSFFGPEAATRWIRGLRAEIDRLAYFPYRNAPRPRSPETRRHLCGRGRSAYRAIYRIVEPQESGDEHLVRILHVYPGLMNIDPDEGNDVE